MSGKGKLRRSRAGWKRAGWEEKELEFLLPSRFIGRMFTFTFTPDKIPK